MTPLIPLALIGGGLYLLSQKKEGGPAPVPINVPTGGQPTFTPDAQDQFTEMRSVPGGAARFFKNDITPGLMSTLNSAGLEPIALPAGTPGLAFRVVALSPGAVSAKNGVMLASSGGKVALATLSLVMQGSSGDRLVLIAAPDERMKVAPANGTFAILLDAGASVAPTLPGASAPGVPGAPPTSPSPFDAGMPPELVAQVNGLLSDPNANPAGLDAAAAALEISGFPIAAKALRDRAAALRAKQGAAGSPPIVLPSLPGTPPATVPAGALGTPFTIRQNDFPSALAQYYTGDGNRWREIAPINAASGMIVTGGANSNLKPWNIGQKILLPFDWNALSKALPVPGTQTNSGVMPAGAAATPASLPGLGLPSAPSAPQTGPGTPFKIRSGDIPSMLAQYYTGAPMRWKEMMPLNPGMKQDSSGNLTNSSWVVGTKVFMPFDWAVESKPLPLPTSLKSSGIPFNAAA